jgi:hypothetical protein
MLPEPSPRVDSDPPFRLYRPPDEQAELPKIDPDREAHILACWPHLARAGAGPHNHVAGSLEDALRRARSRTPALVHRLRVLVRHRPRRWLPILRQLLVEATGKAVGA